MRKAVIEIQDEVNIRFLGLPKTLIEEAQRELTYWVPGFVHMPLYRAGRWDGKIRLLGPTGKTYLNLIYDVLPIFENAGYQFEIDDRRKDWSHVLEQIEYPKEDSYSHCTLKGNPVVLRDYQIDAITAAIDNGQGLLEMATGAGKTLTCAVISDIYSKFGKVVVIVPNIDLVIQTQATFKAIGIDAGIWYGGVKDAKDVTISTWQSLDNFPELFPGVVCCIVDEAHQASAKTLCEIMSGPAANVPFRFGCTGTVPKDELAKQQIKGILGDVIFRLRSWELQKRGVLAQSHIFQIVLEDSKNPTFSTRHIEDWSDEINWMYSDPTRVMFVADMIREIAEDEGNTLVLVPYKKHGKILASLIPGAVSLDGDDKSDIRQEQYKWFNEQDHAVLICTSGIAAVGLDIPRIKVLCMIEPGKKFQKIIQSIGRGLRKADDKDSVLILDVAGDSGFSKKHAKERTALYREAKHEYEIEKINYAHSG